ncbi:hypothetical protein RRSWK_03398 [Rhodopirellula sp. SWK7]|nr:hypothetical protein RRSWK_03398 [Rhodopirellula sp. SWK7]
MFSGEKRRVASFVGVELTTRKVKTRSKNRESQAARAVERLVSDLGSYRQYNDFGLFVESSQTHSDRSE